MSIAILSPRLANQIAAGEVVERPASVVKELVENSIDAAATEILIEIEQGGAKLVKIRDNGCGVPKEQLPLALSRHATSKISTLDDLEAIESLGFRGEALASISSVCRLTFTSKTEQQNEAWQAYAQGREMAVEIVPAAHPTGTTVAVADMFFNTPARRRFLRTEKTEFSHIDELVKRFALSHFDIQFNLKHNGKTLRNLQIAKTTAQRERRVGALCGARFIEHSIAISSEHNGIKLSGWLALPQGCKNNNDIQYCYVNGRMMRDKLINHAIRQAYQDWLPDGLLPSYIIYIEIASSQVDVNVHPAKHEVRFHQARMVHDLIYQVLHSGLSQALADDNIAAPSDNIRPGSVDHSYGHAEASPASGAISDYAGQAYSSSPRQNSARSSLAGEYRPVSNSGQLDIATDAYRALMTTTADLVDQDSNKQMLMSTESKLFGTPLSLVEKGYLLLNRNDNIELLSLTRLAALVNEFELMARWDDGFRGQPLLLPVAIRVDKALLEQLTPNEQLFRRLGIEITVRDPQIIVKQVPELLRQQDIAYVIPQLLLLIDSQRQLNNCQLELSQVICKWLAQFVTRSFSFNQAVQLIEKADGYRQQIAEHTDELRVSVDFSQAISQWS